MRSHWCGSSGQNSIRQLVAPSARQSVAKGLPFRVTESSVEGMDKSPSDLIDELGGPHRVARKLGIEPGTVRMWKVRNCIPRKAWPEILEAFPDTTLRDLKQTEAAA